MKSILTLAALTGALAATPASTNGQEPDPALVARAKAILDKAPLIDTHNDLPSMLLERYGGNIAGLDLGIAHPELCADVPRLRKGGVGAQYWSVFTESANMTTNRSLHEAVREFDVVLGVIRSRPELELALTADDIERVQAMNTDPRVSPVGVPPNTFTQMRAFPSADLRAVVRPNFDTLYPSAWLDLTEGPVIVSTGDTGGRYFMLPMLDMWTDVFAVPGKRTNGTGAAALALVPPGWTGNVPVAVERIDAPTPHVWIIGRTQTNGPRDYEAVHKVQDGYKITLLADWGKSPRKIEQKIDPSVDTKTEPLRVVNQMPAPEYFNYGRR